MIWPFKKYVEFTFDTDAFADAPEVVAKHINELTGHSLATWLVGALRQRGLEVSDVFEEDHGWDFLIRENRRTFDCACCVLTAASLPNIPSLPNFALPEGMREGHVIIGFRGSDAPVVATIEQILATAPEISQLERH